MSSQFPVLTQQVDQDLLFDLMGSWMGDPSIDTDTLRKIIGNDFVKQSWRKLRIDQDNEIDRSNAYETVLAETVTQIRNHYEDIISKLEEEHLTKSKGMETERSGIYSKPLFIIGLLLVIFLVFGPPICMQFFNIELSGTQLTVVAGIATTLIVMSIFGEKAIQKLSLFKT